MIVEDACHYIAGAALLTVAASVAVMLACVAIRFAWAFARCLVKGVPFVEGPDE
jgi:hypothetical protein